MEPTYADLYAAYTPDHAPNTLRKDGCRQVRSRSSNLLIVVQSHGWLRAPGRTRRGQDAPALRGHSPTAMPPSARDEADAPVPPCAHTKGGKAGSPENSQRTWENTQTRHRRGSRPGVHFFFSQQCNNETTLNEPVLFEDLLCPIMGAARPHEGCEVVPNACAPMPFQKLETSELKMQDF